MTREETKKIVRIICDSYPNYKPSNISETIDVWNMMLGEFKYQDIALALKSYILTDATGFAPSIGQIVSFVHKVTVPEELNEMEAWALVSKALRNGYYGAEEEFNKLPPLVQKAVGVPSQLRQWSITDASSVENVIQSNFIKTYRTLAKREKEVQRLPIEAKKRIQMALEGGKSAHTDVLIDKGINS